MNFATLLFTLAAALTAAALPTASNRFIKRSCAVQYPELRADPNVTIPYDVAMTGSNAVEIGFTIPEAATGPCSMMLQMPSGAAISGSAQINVYALDGPSSGSLVGTQTFSSGSYATINSFDCRTQMCYSLEIASGDGSLSFTEDEGMGVVMTYDC